MRQAIGTPERVPLSLPLGIALPKFSDGATPKDFALSDEMSRRLYKALENPPEGATIRHLAVALLDMARTVIEAEMTAPEAMAAPARYTPTRNRPQGTYEQDRQRELDRIRSLDVDYRSQLRNQNHSDSTPSTASRPDEDWENRNFEMERALDQAGRDIHRAKRMLILAVENYLTGCVEIPFVSGDQLVNKALTTDDLVARLQVEEALMIAIYGRPWEEGRPTTPG